MQNFETDEQARKRVQQFEQMLAERLEQADNCDHQPPVGHTQQMNEQATQARADYQYGRITLAQYESAMRLITGAV